MVVRMENTSSGWRENECFWCQGGEPMTLHYCGIPNTAELLLRYRIRIIRKHEVIVHYVICFSTALIHSHIRQPLPCLDRKEPTPLCLSAPPFITQCFFSLKPFTGALPRKNGSVHLAVALRNEP